MLGARSSHKAVIWGSMHQARHIWLTWVLQGMAQYIRICFINKRKDRIDQETDSHISQVTVFKIEI